MLAADRPPKPLAVRQPLGITVNPRDVATYSVAMQPGEFAEIRIRQEGPDVKAPDGGRSEESVLLLADRVGGTCST